MNQLPTPLAIRELRLRDFRNFADVELSFPAAGVAVIGDNGAGKTNLLEAIYYLEIFRSCRGAADEQLVRFGADGFHVRGRFEDAAGTTHEIAAGFERRTRRKRVTVNGAEPERLGDALGRAGVVVFSPSDVAIVAGSPAERRRFLDILLSLNEPGYLHALQRYRLVLRNRNALLRDGASADLLASWDDALVDWGARLMQARARWISAHAAAFAERYAAIADGAATELRYEPGVRAEGDACAAILEGRAGELMHAALGRAAARERERRMTLVGPHRDDLAFLLARGDERIDLREFGSGGQQRTAAIALRMIEANTIRETRGREPIVLLDDVFAELDPGRSRRILELIETEERGQVVLTAPKPSDLEPRRGALPHWRIADGAIAA